MWRGNTSLNSVWIHFTFYTQSFPDAKLNYLLHSKTNEPLPTDIRATIFAYLATFLLDSLLPALDGEIKQQENGQEEKRDRGKRHHLLVFLLSKPALSLLAEDPH